MKLYKLSLALMLGIGTLTSCEDKLDLTNPNQQTTSTFGNSAADLEECVIAAYNHTRMEGTYARVGYNIDVMRGDEAWNCSQVWYMPFDDLNEPLTDEIGQWSWRDWYYTINVCNFITSKVEKNFGTDNSKMSEAQKRIKGQALFLRGLAYYNLANYYQNPVLITSYEQYSSLDGLYASNITKTDETNADENGYAQYDKVLDQVEKDLSEAMEILPSREVGGEWAKGRATCGAAAGFYARALMQRHKFDNALVVLKDIIAQKYGKYELMADYGDNFREGAAYENNAESLYEVQFLDKDQQGTDDEWTPVNTSAYATQGSAIESNFAPGDLGGWADIAASPWLYQLFKSEYTTNNKLDPRLYWTIGTYEADWDNYANNAKYANGNVCYNTKMTDDNPVVVNNNYGGLPIAKWTHFRTGEYDKVVTGLHSGINLRLMRYSDVLLRAAECINEQSGPTEEAIGYINQVRNRAGLASLKLKDFPTADALFEQIANVERPKEFGCEYGRGNDLIRWGWFYDESRMQQLKEHGTFRRTTDKTLAKSPVSYSEVGIDTELKSSYDTYVQGHEYLPIYQGTLNDNANLVGNSANKSTSNLSYFQNKGWKIRPAYTK